MNFLDLQKDLQVLIWDTRSVWLPDETGLWSIWASNKAAINHGIKQVFDRLKQNSLYKEQNNIEVTLQIENYKATLPTDFAIEFEVIYSDEPFFDYTINKPTNSLVFDRIESWKIILKYLKKEPILVDIDDESNIEEHFKEAISLFAMEKYHAAQFDWDNIAKSVAYAEDKMEDLISKYF